MNFKKNVHNFRIDLYLPDQKLAIEIDEKKHTDRDPIYEQEREEHKLRLGCEYIRINLDAEDFKLSSCVGIKIKAIIHS